MKPLQLDRSPPIQGRSFIHSFAQNEEAGPRIRAKVEIGFGPVNQGVEGAARLTGAKLPFTTKTLQTGRVNVKALNSLEREPTSVLPNLSPTINRPKYRVARLCNDTVEGT